VHQLANLGPLNYCRIGSNIRLIDPEILIDSG
jgi:hypothetical protein